MRTERSAKLVTIDGKRVIFQLDGGEEFFIPKDDISPGAQVGDDYTIFLMPSSEAKLESDELARTLLNEILRNDHSERE